MDLPISALKIDACFVRELPENKQQEAVCMMIIDMAQRLELMVIAEGAETREQVEFLLDKNCDQVQGFFHSPAIPLEQLPRFIQEQRFKRREMFFS
jgi:EAL domain-containing protein (putative c-di-GMP-specific phosphodiesterase class I)